MKKAERNVRDLNEKLNNANKKISELENTNTRLQLKADQAQEVLDSKSSREKEVNHSPPPRRRESTSSGSKQSPSRCKSDNSGKCRKGRECREVHAQKTCQLYSKLGICQLSSQCDFRHPTAECHEWREHGTCRYGDECRYRHPLHVISSHNNHFLVQEDPAPKSQWPAYSHRDQRGNRW